MVTTGNLNLSPEALAALAQKANRSDNELARSLGISMDEIVDAQLPDTDANNKQIFESNPFFDPTKFGQALAANARFDAGGYITAEEINKSENGKDEENDLLDIIQNNLAREEAERERALQELDAMPWVGDKNEVWDLGDGVSGTREDLYNKGKTAWDKSRKEADKRGLSDKDKDKLNDLYEQYLKAIKDGDLNAAIRFKNQMPDWAQKDLEDNNKFQTSNTVQQIDARKAQDVSVSTNSGSDLITNIQNDVVAGGAVKTPVSAKTDFEKVAPNIAAPIQQIAQLDVKPQSEVKQTFDYDMGFG